MTHSHWGRELGWSKKKLILGSWNAFRAPLDERSSLHTIYGKKFRIKINNLFHLSPSTPWLLLWRRRSQVCMSRNLSLSCYIVLSCKVSKFHYSVYNESFWKTAVPSLHVKYSNSGTPRESTVLCHQGHSDGGGYIGINTPQISLP